MSTTAIVALLQAALMLLTLAQSSPALPQSVRDNAVQVAQQAISQATTALSSGQKTDSYSPDSPSASFDASSLYATTEKDVALVTVTGTAHDVSSVTLALKGEDGGSANVVNGHWSVALRLSVGSYQLELLNDRSNTVLAMGTLTIAPPKSVSIVLSSMSSNAVTVSYANLPANSQIRFVNAATGAVYGAQSTMVSSGGTGTTQISIPADLAAGQYYLRLTNYYDPNTSLGQTTAFTVGGSAMTNPVVISTFSASSKYVTPGQSITLSWKANLSDTDVTTNGGFCDISALTESNSQLHIFHGPSNSGSMVHSPTGNETLTLTCTSGGKDGSPIATKDIRITVSYAAGLPQCPTNAAQQRSNIGQTYECSCAPGFPMKTVWGGPSYYSDNSDICTAGAQSGQINFTYGGEVDYTVAAGQSSYPSWTANSITSQSYSDYWPGSFQITGPKG